MDHNNASGPDGFPAEFHKKLDIRKKNWMDMFMKLQLGVLPLYKLTLVL